VTHTFVDLGVVVEGAGGEDEFSELLARMLAVDPRILPVFCGRGGGFFCWFSRFSFFSHWRPPHGGRDLLTIIEVLL